MSTVHYIARCSRHGLHGQRDMCFECGAPVEQVAMVEINATALDAATRAVHEVTGGRLKYGTSRRRHATTVSAAAVAQAAIAAYEAARR